MKPDNRFTLSYLRTHPTDAARTLERLPAATAGALLEALGTEVVAPLVACMSPSAAASCLARMTPERAATLLQHIRAASAALILSTMPPEPARDLLARFGTTAGLRVRRLLHRPPGSVGAVMTPAPPTLSAALTVGDAVKRMQQQRSDPACDLYLVDDTHRLVGIVNTATLLRAGGRRPLRSLAARDYATLHTSTALAAAVNHAGWRTRRILPVTESDGTLVGILDRQTLLDATEAGIPGQGDPLDNVLELVNLYWIALAETVQMMAGTDNNRKVD